MGPTTSWIARRLAFLVMSVLLWGCGVDGAGEGGSGEGGTAPGESDGVVHALVVSEATRPDSNRASHVALATNAEEAAEEWGRFQLPGTPPDVDFSVDVLLFLAGAESTGCPLEPAGLVVDRDAPSVIALLEPRAEDCPGDDLPRTLVYRVQAADLPPTPFHAGIASHRLLPVR